jgi:type VI secretion system secreted protein Hcp
MANNTIFLKMDPIKGSAQHQKFIGAISLNSFSTSAAFTLTEDVSNTQRTSGKAIGGDFTLTKDVDLATTEIYQYCLLATLVKVVELHIGTNNGMAGAWQPTLVYTMKDVLIKSISTSGSGTLPTDTFVLQYASISVAYTQQKTDTVAAGNGAFTFDKATTKGP